MSGLCGCCRAKATANNIHWNSADTLTHFSSLRRSLLRKLRRVKLSATENNRATEVASIAPGNQHLAVREKRRGMVGAGSVQTAGIRPGTGSSGGTGTIKYAAAAPTSQMQIPGKSANLFHIEDAETRVQQQNRRRHRRESSLILIIENAVSFPFQISV